MPWNTYVDTGYCSYELLESSLVKPLEQARTGKCIVRTESRDETLYRRHEVL